MRRVRFVQTWIIFNRRRRKLHLSHATHISSWNASWNTNVLDISRAMTASSLRTSKQRFFQLLWTSLPSNLSVHLFSATLPCPPPPPHLLPPLPRLSSEHYYSWFVMIKLTGQSAMGYNWDLSSSFRCCRMRATVCVLHLFLRSSPVDEDRRRSGVHLRHKPLWSFPADQLATRWTIGDIPD